MLNYLQAWSCTTSWYFLLVNKTWETEKKVGVLEQNFLAHLGPTLQMSEIESKFTHKDWVRL